jgi:DNA-binding XRE family transcriptional regulator
MLSKSKYYPLYLYLEEQDDAGLLELSFAEVEAILGESLPKTAKKTRAWWANSQTSQGRTWQNAGWLVDDVDFKEQYVAFRPARITYRVSPIRKSQGWTADQIKSLREHAGWSQQDLADRLGVRQQTVSDWELGIHTSRRSMGKLLRMVAETVKFPYQTEIDEDEDDNGEDVEN